MPTHALEEPSIQRECRLHRCHGGRWRSWGQSSGYLLLERSTAGGFLGQASGRHPRVTGGLLPERGRGTLGLPQAAGRTHGRSQWQSPGLGGFRRGWTQGLVPPCLGELSLPSLCCLCSGPCSQASLCHQHSQPRGRSVTKAAGTSLFSVVHSSPSEAFGAIQPFSAGWPRWGEGVTQPRPSQRRGVGNMANRHVGHPSFF